ncbi:MAG: glycoside hydrolase family 57 protein [Spirochaetia bacterium]|nr:glycoside hydrolase family 57 protein [Spirochaetia bacterium]
MVSVCFYFEVHQPYRVKPYHFLEIGKNPFYFEDEGNYKIARKVGDKCYLPTTELLLRLIKRYGKDFKVTFSITGTAIEQFRRWYPEVLDNFKKLADTESVEFLAETYYHSLSSLYHEDEFKDQVKMHIDLMRSEFGRSPIAFRNTELIFTSHIAWLVQEMGFSTMLLEGADRVLGWRSPNFVYRAKHSPSIKCLLKNYRLSDDIAFRFSNRSWKDWPLSTEKFAKWVHNVAGNGTNINLFMDFETFGEHQWEDTGIFGFMEDLPHKILQHPDYTFDTVSQTASKHPVMGDIESDSPVSWADEERDLSAWRGNTMQHEALSALYELTDEIREMNNPDLLEAFRKLQTSDHFYYMSTKFFNDGDVHKYFSPYSSPHDAYVYFMNLLHDFRIRLKEHGKHSLNPV